MYDFDEFVFCHGVLSIPVLVCGCLTRVGFMSPEIQSTPNQQGVWPRSNEGHGGQLYTLDRNVLCWIRTVQDSSQSPRSTVERQNIPQHISPCAGCSGVFPIGEKCNCILFSNFLPHDQQVADKTKITTRGQWPEVTYEK